MGSSNSERLRAVADLVLSSLEYYLDASSVHALRRRRIERQRERYRVSHPEEPVTEVHIDDLDPSTRSSGSTASAGRW
jgi:hypothetical protein